MFKIKTIILSVILLSTLFIGATCLKQDSAKILSYTVDPKQDDMRFFYMNDSGERYGDFQGIIDSLTPSDKQLLFAVNGGMFKEDRSPLGLYVEDGKELAPLNTELEGYGNFYLQPNGVF